MTARDKTLGAKVRELADKVQDAIQSLVDMLNPPTPVRVPVTAPARRRVR